MPLRSAEFSVDMGPSLVSCCSLDTSSRRSTLFHPAISTFPPSHIHSQLSSHRSECQATSIRSRAALTDPPFEELISRTRRTQKLQNQPRQRNTRWPQPQKLCSRLQGLPRRSSLRLTSTRASSSSLPLSSRSWSSPSCYPPALPNPNSRTGVDPLSASLLESSLPLQ